MQEVHICTSGLSPRNIGELPKLCGKFVLIADWSVAHFVVIVNDVMNDNMAAFAHVGARLGAFFNWAGCLENNVPFDNMPLIYLINLLGKLVLGLWLDSELHYFSIFTENKKNEHPSANVTDVNLVLKERTQMRLCLNMLIFTHNLGNWLILQPQGITAL